MGKLLKKYNSLGIEAKAALWFVFCNFLNKGISMIIVPIYTRILPTAEYGKYSVFQSWLNIFVILATLEISRGHYKVGIVKYEDDLKRYASSALGLGSTVTLVFLAVYLAGAGFFNGLLGMTTPIMVAMFLYLMVYPAWEFWSIDQRFAYKYKRMVFATLLVSVLTPVIGIVGITVFRLQGEAAIYAKLAVQGFVALVLYAAFVKRSRALWNGKYWKEVFLFNIALIPYLLSVTVLNQADRIMIERMIGAEQAAIYSVAYSVAVLFQLFNTAISDAFVPWMYRRLKEESYGEIEPANDRLLILVAVLNLMLVLFAPEAVRIFAPAQYHEAIWIIPPVTASVFFVFLFTRYINVEIYYETSSQISAVSILVALLNIVLNYIFIQRHGYLAAGYTTLVCYALFCISHFMIVRSICRKKCGGQQIFTAKRTVIIAAVFLAAVFVIMSLYNHSVLRYAMAAALAVYAYLKRDLIKWVLKSKKSD